MPKSHQISHIHIKKCKKSFHHTRRKDIQLKTYIDLEDIKEYEKLAKRKFTSLKWKKKLVNIQYSSHRIFLVFPEDQPTTFPNHKEI